MSEQAGEQVNAREAELPGKRAAMPELREMIAGLISENLRKTWVEEEPTERCFDHDETQIASLLSFIDENHDGAEADAVRDHLLRCPRCRYLYARAREVAQSGVTCRANLGPGAAPEKEAAPEVLRAHLRSTGPVVFPGDEVTEGAWEFGLLGEIPPETAERISEVIAERAWRKLWGLVPGKGVVILCFGNPMHRCGKRLAVKMTNAGVKDIHVVMADDFFSPKLWCDPRELNGCHVVVFLDVVHSGGLLNRLATVCRQGDPGELTGMVVIDQSGGNTSDVPLVGLWAEQKERRELRDLSVRGEVRYFDPVMCRARPGRDLPLEFSDPDRARATIECRLKDLRPIARYIQATGALRRDARIGGVCYPWAVDVLRLLRHDEARAELAQRAASCLSDLADRGRGAWSSRRCVTNAPGHGQNCWRARSVGQP